MLQVSSAYFPQVPVSISHARPSSPGCLDHFLTRGSWEIKSTGTPQTDKKEVNLFALSKGLLIQAWQLVPWKTTWLYLFQINSKVHFSDHRWTQRSTLVQVEQGGFCACEVSFQIRWRKDFPWRKQQHTAQSKNFLQRWIFQQKSTQFFIRIL